MAGPYKNISEKEIKARVNLVKKLQKISGGKLSVLQMWKEVSGTVNGRWPKRHPQSVLMAAKRMMNFTLSGRKMPKRTKPNTKKKVIAGDLSAVMELCGVKTGGKIKDLYMSVGEGAEITTEDGLTITISEGKNKD